MKSILKQLSHLVLGIFTCSIVAHAQSELKYSDVVITIPREKVLLLQQNGLDFDHAHYDEEKQTLSVVLNHDDVQKLSTMTYPYKVRIADVAADFEKTNKPGEFFKHANDPVKTGRRFAHDSPSSLISNNFTTPTAFTSDGAMGGYYTLSQIITKINTMVSNYPGLVRKDTVGYTWQSRPIIVVKISSNVNTESGKPEVLYTGLNHAREPMSMMNLIFFMQYLLENYSTNTMVKELVDNRSLYFIPVLNPDGYERNRSTNSGGGGMHRKNRRANTNTTNMGVDLNRNYSYGWNDANGGSSTTVTNDAYRGPSALSEPESLAMTNYINTRNFKFALNYHAYGEYWINSFCVTPAPGDALTALESKFVETAGHLMTRTNFYLVGTPIQTVGYNARGSIDDWMIAGAGHSRMYGFSPEIGPSASAFWPTSGQIIPLAKEVMFANFQAAYIAGSYAKIEDRSALAVNSVSGNFDFTVRRLGLTNSPVTVSIVPLQNIQSVGTSVTTSLADLLDTYNGSISYNLSPGIQMGQKIRFLWKVESGGISLVDTITKLYNPTVVVSDNMEGTIGTNWTTSGTWAFASTSAYAGTKSLVTNSAANYGNNASATARLTNVLNLSNSNTAYLTFWTRYRAQGGYDKLRIQAAANGNGAGATWVNMPSSYTVAENKATIGGIPSLTGIQDFWVREMVDLSAFAGGTTVGLRFLFESNATTTGNGFFIDNLEVIKSTSSTLPVSFESIKALAGNNDITVSWQASTNEQHDHFEVERSSDGVSFSLLGKEYGRGSDFIYVDHDPVPGVNYYRVRGVDKDGKFNYTPVVSARFNTAATFHVYPNPVQNQLQLKINATINAKYEIEFIASNGQAVKKLTQNIITGLQTINISVSDLRAGAYMLQVRNRSEIISTVPFIKTNQ